jgi:hypothetical protein
MGWGMRRKSDNKFSPVPSTWCRNVTMPIIGATNRLFQ